MQPSARLRDPGGMVKISVIIGSPFFSWTFGMAKVFGDFDVSDFWEPSEYAEREYTSTPPTDEMVATVERQRHALARLSRVGSDLRTAGRPCRSRMDYTIAPVAKTFEAFVRGLED